MTDSLTDHLAMRQQLVEAALQVRTRAYAPYSNFWVGAAVRTTNGDLFAGCNVENASYGLTLCAERNAVFQAVAAGQRRLSALALAASRGATPCGACRQVLTEFADDIPVWIVDPERPEIITELRLNALLPHRFALNP